MTFLARLRSFLRAAIRRTTFEREMESELQFHLDARAADLVAAGLDRASAARQARQELGDPLRWKEEGREARGLALVDHAVTDLRYGLRWLRRQPTFAVAAISTLSLAIAANATMFAITDAALFKPLPFADAERLVWVSSVRADNPSAPVTLPEFMDYRARTRSLSGLAAYANWSASLSGEGVTERFQGARLSGNAFETLGVTASAGRLLADADDRADAPHVAVISHRLWQHRFGGAPDIVGRQLRINGDPVTIVGVLPAHFPLPLRDIDVVVPLAPDRDPVRHLRSSTNFLRMFGRLGAGVSVEQARQELTTICAQLREEHPGPYAGKLSISAEPLVNAIAGELAPTMVLLLGSVVVVLSTALANLLCLVLVRTNDRRGEISIRVAMGASRARLVRQFAIEALALTIIAGAIGVGLAVVATSSAMAWAPSAIPRLGEVRFDIRALLVAAVLTLAAAALFAVAPLGTMFRTGAHHALRLVSRSSIGSRWNHRLRDGLVVAEISSALVLLLTTTVLVRDFVHQRSVAPGFTPDAVFQARVSLPVNYSAPADIARFNDQLMARLTQLPGVRDVGLISVAPLSGVSVTVPFSVVGGPESPESGRLPSTNYRVITSNYLAAAGTRIVQGRSFTEQDRAETLKVALVSAAFARRWLGDTPVGRQIMINDNNTGPRAVDVVGVVEDVRQLTMSGPAAFDLYIPLSQIHPDGVTFIRNNQFWMIRTETEPAALRNSFITALQAVDRDAAVSGAGTMRQGLEQWFAPRRFSLAMFVAFSMTAVLLAVSGLYGLVAYAVSQRRREIGLRMALGASIVDIRRMILRDATRLATLGIGLGIVVAFAARPITAWLIGNTTIDPLLTSVTAFVLFLIVLLAGVVPAYRASRIEPTIALRAD